MFYQEVWLLIFVISSANWNLRTDGIAHVRATAKKVSYMDNKSEHCLKIKINDTHAFYVTYVNLLIIFPRA